MVSESHSELTIYFIEAFNKLAFSSEVNFDLPNINRSANLGSEREAILL